MREAKITFREAAIAGFVFAVLCAVYITPIRAAGMSLLQAVIEDRGGYTTIYPAWEAARHGYLNGMFPIWVDVSASPVNVNTWVFANFSPFYLLTIPFEFHKIADVFFVSRLWLMAVFAYLFCRRGMKLGVAGSALAAVSFAFSGIAQKRLMTTEMNVPWTIPFFLWATMETVLKPRVRWMIFAAFAAAFAIYAGHPIAAFYVFFMGGLWVLFLFASEKPGIVAGSAVLIGAGFIALFLGGLQLIPGLEGMAWNFNYHFESPLEGSYPVEGLFSLALPWLIGANKTNFAVSFVTPYIGAVTVLSAVYGVVNIRRLGKYPAFFAAYFIVFLGLSYALPVFSLIGLAPPFNRLMNAVSAFPTVTFASAALAGAALDYLSRNPSRAKTFGYWATGAIFLTLISAIYAHYLIHEFRDNPITSFFFKNSITAHWWLIAQTLFGCATFAALAVASVWTSKRKNAASIAIVALAFFGLWVDSWGWNQENPGLLERLKTSKAAEYIKTTIKPGENTVSKCDVLDPNFFILFDGHGFSIDFPMPMRRHTELLLALNSIDLSSDEGMKKFERVFGNKFYLPFPVERFGTPLSDMLGIRFCSVCETSPLMGAPVFSADAAIYESDTTVPEAFLTGRWELLENEKAVLSRLLGLKRGEERTAFLSKSDPGVNVNSLPKIVEDTQGTVQVTARNWQKLELSVTASDDSILVNRGLYYQGWRVWVDGSERKIFPADYLWRGTVVPKGAHKVKFVYEPAGFRIALWVFSASVFCLIVVAVLLSIKSGAKKQTE